MNFTETSSYLKWISQFDARIQTTDPSVQFWQDALANATTNEVRQATLEFTRINEGVMLTPAAIRRMTYALRERTTAVQSALTAGPAMKNPNTYRARNPELWEQLMAEGARQHQAELQRKGIL